MAKQKSTKQRSGASTAAGGELHQSSSTSMTTAAAVDFVRDAFGHLKVIGYTSGASALLRKAGIDAEADRGLVAVDAASGTATFVNQAKRGKVWEREPTLRTVY